MKIEDVVKSLYACSVAHNCAAGCCFGGQTCVNDLLSMALTKLKELSTELEDERYRHDRYVDFELAEAAELVKVKTQLDSAMKELRLQNCDTCKHEQLSSDEWPCNICSCAGGDANQWVWHGVNENE